MRFLEFRNYLLPLNLERSLVIPMTKLDHLLSILKKDHIFIQMHNYPDQDALACAKGLQELLLSYHIQSTICYQGHVDKLNTIMMIERLHIDIRPIESIYMTDNDEIILVDCQKGNLNVNNFTGTEVACIDHHKKQHTDCYLFHDIRSDVGACSSIITSYFLENNLTITTEMATTLLYGIKIDTANLSREVSNLDLDMFCMLYKLADQTILRKLDCCTLKVKDLASYKKAISSLKIYNKIGFANIGNNCSEAMIGTLSDFLLSLEEIHVALVYSYRNFGLKFSVRSENPDMDASDIIKEILSGYGDGGGHSTMAAGFIPHIYSESMAHNITAIVEQRLLTLFS